MTTVADIHPKDPKLLIYGSAGAGKTALSLTLGSSAQILDLDDGLTTGQTLKDSHRDARLKVDVKQFLETEPQRVATAYRRVKDYIYSLPKMIQSSQFPFDALIIDSLTSLGESCSRFVMGNSGDPGAAPQLPHWGIIVTEMQNVFSVLRTLPITVILLAHDEPRTEGKITDPNSKEVTSIAVPTRKLVTRIPRFFDEVWYLKVRSTGGRKREFYIQTLKTEDVVCRTRASLPDGFVFASIDGDKSITSIGLWDILDRIGYKKPVRKEKTNVVTLPPPHLIPA